jgi:hypothetical protein
MKNYLYNLAQNLWVVHRDEKMKSKVGGKSFGTLERFYFRHGATPKTF